MRDEQFTIIGRNPVIEAFRAGKAVDRLFLQDGVHDGPVSTIIREAKKAGIKPEFVKKERLDEIAGQGSHQGAIAYLAAFHYSTVEEILDYAREKNESPFIFILDGLEDPHVRLILQVLTVSSFAKDGLWGSPQQSPKLQQAHWNTPGLQRLPIS